MINLFHVLTWAALVVACWFLISAWRLHHQVRQQLKALQTPPVPPTSVRVVQPDGSEDPVELVYQGRAVDGIHSRVAVPTSPFLTPDDHAKSEAHPWEIERRVMVVTPVAAVMAALDGIGRIGRVRGTDAKRSSETPCTRSCSERSRPFVLTFVSTEGPIPEKRTGNLQANDDGSHDLSFGPRPACHSRTRNVTARDAASGSSSSTTASSRTHPPEASTSIRPSTFATTPSIRGEGRGPRRRRHGAGPAPMPRRARRPSCWDCPRRPRRTAPRGQEGRRRR